MRIASEAPALRGEANPAEGPNGDFFGEGCLSGQPLRLATVATMTDCVIMRIEKSAMVQVLHDQSSFSEMFMSYLLTRNSRVEEDLVDQFLQFERKTSGKSSPLDGEFREGR